jgi:hypothetical protein
MLKWLCAAGALLVVAFLFYDEFEANLFLIAYGLIALTAFFMFLGTTRGRCHRKYIEYRLFAETLRVQLNLMASGLNVSVEDLMPWSQRTISPWIREAMNTLPRIEQAMPEAPVDVRAVWIREQLQLSKAHARKEQSEAETPERDLRQSSGVYNSVLRRGPGARVSVSGLDRPRNRAARLALPAGADAQRPFLQRPQHIQDTARHHSALTFVCRVITESCRSSESCGTGSG